MNRSDTPPYAADVVASASIGRQFVVSVGIFIALLLGMSAVEEPMARHNPDGEFHAASAAVPRASPLPCGTGSEPVG